jgi:hypothetical protein
MDPIGTDSLELQDWLIDPSVSLENDSPAAAAGDNKSWVLELYDHANHGPFLSTQPLIPNPDPNPSPDAFYEILKLLQEQPSAAIIAPSIPAADLPTLNSDLVNHPCCVPSALSWSLRSLAWGWILAEMSHLIVQHVKIRGMGSMVPDGIFNEIHEASMKRLGRSPFRLEPGKSFTLFSCKQTDIHLQ